MLQELKDELKTSADPEKAKLLQRFFKTGKGEYGEGDIFLGIKVPDQRAIARKYNDISLKDAETMVSSNIHEHRLTALLILVDKYKRADPNGKKQIFEFYLKSRSRRSCR